MFFVDTARNEKQLNQMTCCFPESQSIDGQFYG